MMRQGSRIKGLETRSIDYVPASERHGHPFSQFTLWWGVELNVIFVGTGCFAPAMGLNMAWSMIAIVLGLMIGGIFMAFHSAQGPHLGIPQMIQSRAQFGVKGAVIPLILAIILYMGYYTTTLYYAAQALDPVHVPIPVAVVIAAVMTLVITIYGYDFIHRAQQVACIVGTILFAGVTYAMLAYFPLPAAQWALGDVDPGNFLFVLSVYISVLAITAPYVADYSRYLPEDTSIPATFWNTYAGAVGGISWICLIGAYLYIIMPDVMNVNATVGVADTWETAFPFVTVIFIILLFTAVCSCTVSLYGAFMAVVTTLSPFTRLRGTKKAKIIIMSVTVLIGSLIAIFATSDIITQWGNYLATILYFIIPWTSINLVDYYFVRKGKYSLKDIFDPKGIYGSFNKKALLTYFVTVAVELPFMNSAFFVGPVAEMTGGADIAWLVGGITSAVLYYVFNRDIAKTTTWSDMKMHTGFDREDQEALEKQYET
jgi:NCS1 family nucleobase:cation symporter-1